MGKKYDAPPAPDYEKLLQLNEMTIASSEKIAQEYLDLGRQVFAQQQEITQKILDVQLPAMKAEAEAATAERQRYMTEGVPAERAYLEKLRNWDTPERREERAGQAIADQRTAQEAARATAIKQLQDFGLDPSQTRSKALDAQIRTANAAAQAQAATNARDSVEREGLSLGAEAVNITRGLPGVISGAFNTSQGAAGTSTAAGMAPGAAYSQVAGGAGNLVLGGANARSGGYQVASNIYGNQVQSAANSMQGSMAMMDTLGSMFGAAAGVMAASDVRVKDDIRYVGEDRELGLPIYEYRYKGDPEKRKFRGPMAQDVKEKYPEAVENVYGLLMVDFDKLEEAAQ